MHICPRARSARKFWDFDPSYMQKCPKNCPILSSLGYFKKSPPHFLGKVAGARPPLAMKWGWATFRFRVPPPHFWGGGIKHCFRNSRLALCHARLSYISRSRVFELMCWMRIRFVTRATRRDVDRAGLPKMNDLAHA